MYADRTPSSSPPLLPSSPPSSPEHPHLPAYLSPVTAIPSLPLVDLVAVGGSTYRGTFGRSASYRETDLSLSGPPVVDDPAARFFVTATVPTPVAVNRANALRKTHSCEEPEGTVAASPVDDDTHRRLHRFTSQFGPNDPFGHTHSFTRAQSWQLAFRAPDAPSFATPKSGPATQLPLTPESVSFESPQRPQPPAAWVHTTPTASSSSSSSRPLLGHQTTPLSQTQSSPLAAMDVDDMTPPGRCPPRKLGFSPLGRRSQSYYPGASLKRKLLFDDSACDTRASGTEQALQIISAAVDTGASHEVDLSGLGLAAVPSEVTQLQHLVVLAHNQTLRSDLILYLNQNALYSLPSGLFDLTNLTVLILSSNYLTRLPPAIRQLTHLKELSLGNNQLSFLPAEIMTLPALTVLNVHPNPLVPPGGGSEGQTPTDLARYLTALTTPITPHLDLADPARFVHPYPVPDAACPVQLLYVHGPPRLVDLAARAVSIHKAKVFPYHGQHAAGRSLAAASKRARVPAPRFQSEHWVPTHLRHYLNAAAGNRCAVCGGHFAVPYLEELAWTRVCQHPDIPLLIRVCSAPCRYTARWTEMTETLASRI
ncbi:hypothetical protein IWQ60_003164 [Tieghemiomyces parasiticus]|uniref:Uncharacterized protein n=1 Tax=Tieghemiomyces parasiticus TaxID=78921 RepID=A0A9W8ADS5_9FUNG|nr:hypothetical protein IWQ60_003164 [Tieghemiomyces parasiticus]